MSGYAAPVTPLLLAGSVAGASNPTYDQIAKCAELGEAGCAFAPSQADLAVITLIPLFD